jgi:hypothetical protein
MLQDLLEWRKRVDFVNRPGSNDEVCSPGQYWFDQLGNISASVLVIGIGIHDNVGPEFKTCVDTGDEGGG